MATRRDAGRPRGQQLRNTILKATIAELAAHGIDGVSIARIAEAAEVNKTTIYRKWPTVEALVLEALRASLDEATGTIEDTGSLHGDLCGLVRQVAERMSSPTGLALTQAAFAERFNAMAKVLANTPLMRQHTALAQLVTRAAARGEWDLAKHPPEVVLPMLAGSVMHRVQFTRQPATDAWIETVVDVIVRGLAPDER